MMADLEESRSGEVWETYVNILLRMVNGRGIIKSMKRAISATRSRKT